MTTQSEDANNVFITVFDTDLLRFKHPEWDALSKEEKLQLLRTSKKPMVKTHNVTCIGLHRILAQYIDPEQSANEEIAQLAIGDDATAFNSADTALNNQIGKSDITDTVYDSTNAEVLIETFIDSTELNGNTFAELGILGDGGTLFNHAAISPTVTKTDTKTVIIDVTLGFTDA